MSSSRKRELAGAKLLVLYGMAPRSVPGPDLSSTDTVLVIGYVNSSVSFPNATWVSSDSSVSGTGRLTSHSELLFGSSW